MDKIKVELDHEKFIALETLLQEYNDRPWIINLPQSSKIYVEVQKDLVSARKEHYEKDKGEFYNPQV